MDHKRIHVYTDVAVGWPILLVGQSDFRATLVPKEELETEPNSIAAPIHIQPMLPCIFGAAPLGLSMLHTWQASGSHTATVTYFKTLLRGYLSNF